MEESNSRLISLLKNMCSEEPDLLAQIYERHGVDWEDAYEDLVNEIRRDGSNSIFTFFRGGEGVDYDEIVRDVASAMEVEFKDEAEVIEVERAIFGKLAESLCDDELDRKKIADILGMSPSQLKRKGALKKAVQGATYGIIRKIMGVFIARQGMKKVPTLVGLTIPLLNLVFAGWLMFDIAGPAFRKTIPTVIDVAIFRLQYLTNDES